MIRFECDYLEGAHPRILIKKVCENDAIAVADLEKKIFPDSWTATGVKETLAQNNTLILGAWEDERLIGYVIVYFVPDEGEIARIAVEEQRRRQGVAGHLMLGLEDFCEEHKIARLKLEVRESNETAIAFYKDHGFTEDGIRKGYYADPKEDAVLMSREFGR